MLFLFIRNFVWLCCLFALRKYFCSKWTWLILCLWANQVRKWCCMHKLSLRLLTFPLHPVGLHLASFPSSLRAGSCTFSPESCSWSNICCLSCAQLGGAPNLLLWWNNWPGNTTWRLCYRTSAHPFPFLPKPRSRNPFAAIFTWALCGLRYICLWHRVIVSGSLKASAVSHWALPRCAIFSSWDSRRFSCWPGHLSVVDQYCMEALPWKIIIWTSFQNISEYSNEFKFTFFYYY